MRCHYEVLDVPRDAEEPEIKVAYRRLALKWHPDKNLDNPEYAKEQFQVVQQAYEVLSDRQERAWYDKHREQILRGSNSEFQDNSLDVFQYFTTACFRGYGDDEQGFYAVYRNVFENIAKEDMEFMEEKEEYCEIPAFGNSKTDYDRVSEFYTYWLNYSTKKSYVWLDPHNLADIKERRYAKLVEKENKKVRQKAKKERNEEIRNLVAFVRKRDKRVQAQKKIQEQKSLEDKAKRELLSRQKRLERRQQLNDSGNQPEWAKFENFKTELEDIERSLVEQFGEEFSNSDCEEDEEDCSVFYCAACNKPFKTPKAFKNHESSKRHKENVMLLKEAMLEEDKLDSESNISDNLEEYNESNDDIDKLLGDQFENGDIQSDSESLEEIVKTKQKKKKKPRNVMSVDLQDTQHNAVEGATQETEDNFDFNSAKKQKRKNKKNAGKPSTEQSGTNVEQPMEHLNNGDLKDITNASKSRKKKGKKECDVETRDLDHSCVTCQSSFGSKNKLFDHLKKTGHGVYIPPNIKNKCKKKNIKET